MILIKGNGVRLATVDDYELYQAEVKEFGSWSEKNEDGAILHYSLTIPASYGIIHDTEGQYIPPCFVYLGPFRRQRKVVELDRAGRGYFGAGYVATGALVDIPRGPWNSVAQVRVIVYQRDRGRYASEIPYQHVFRRPVTVSRCGRFHCLELSDSNDCVANWRGFVNP